MEYVRDRNKMIRRKRQSASIVPHKVCLEDVHYAISVLELQSIYFFMSHTVLCKLCAPIHSDLSLLTKHVPFCPNVI